ncbi:Rho guanine nucleotide exchange factor [Marasmius tenuissimus]|nr:Rho guanine nucleotide exchange factor [Marasmius tenuissimus]
MASETELKRLEQTLKWTFADKSWLQSFLAKKGRPAQQWLDHMQQASLNLSPELRSPIFTAMLRLSKNSGLYPTCLSIQNVKKMGDYPIAAGGFGDVWKGTIGDSSELVCLKVVKVYLKSDLVKLTNEYLREAILWRQLKHPNVLPFFGIYRLEHTQQLCLISPWMEKGNLVEFLKATKREDVDHYTLVFDVTSGLAYLHSRKIVHGDLKGLNILITCSFRACIADFGLSRITDTNGLRITASTTRPVGTARWLAPELLVENGRPSKESDMYSYACVCHEIFTGLQPFPELANEMTVALNVVQGKRPSRPEGAPELSDAMWALMNVCWGANPSSRPSASHVLEKVEQIVARASPASDWNESLFTQVWENVEYRSFSPGSPNGSQLKANRIFSDLLEVTPSGMHERTTSFAGPIVPNNSNNDSISIPLAMGTSKVLDPPHAYQHLPSTGHPHQTHHRQHTGTDTTATMEMTAPSRPSSGIAQHSYMNSLAPSTMVLHDIENSNVRKEIKETGKGRRISGWLSRWTTGGGDKDKDHDHGPRERRQSWQLVRPEEQGELTRLIGFLTATSSEDWALVLDVCERASASDSNAKEAVRTLRNEFKYGQPQAQLSAARLWAIMLRNSTDTFIGQSTSRKFLETLEELLLSSRTNPVVKERVLNVLAAAAYASGISDNSLLSAAIFTLPPGCTQRNAKIGIAEKDIGFCGLWKKVKPHNMPDEGMPFDTDDDMFNPPVRASSGVGRDGNDTTRPKPATPVTPKVYPAPVSLPAEHRAIFKAKALYSYTSEVPGGLSFAKGMVLDILSANDEWWRAQAPNGTIGTVPSNFMRRLGEVPVDLARALEDFCSSSDDLNTFSFAKDDILDVLDTTGEKWHVRKSDGTLGDAPPSSLVLLFGGYDPFTFIEYLGQPRLSRSNEAPDSAARQVRPRAAPRLRRIKGYDRGLLEVARRLPTRSCT